MTRRRLVATFSDWLELFRAGNCITGLVGVFLGATLALEAIPSGDEARITLLLGLSVYAFMASWNALNDYLDLDIDKVNQPGRPIPSGRISISSARNGILLMMAISLGSLAQGGLIASGLTEDFSSWYPAVFIWLAAILLLVNYESIGSVTLGLKERGLPGNLAISLSVGLVVLFGAAGVFDPWNQRAMSLFFIGTLYNLAREIIKDIEDMEGDEGRNTFAMRVGAEKARAVAWAILLVTMIALISPFALNVFPDIHLILMAPALFMLTVVKKHLFLAEDTAAQKMTKKSMILALIGILISALV